MKCCRDSRSQCAWAQHALIWRRPLQSTPPSQKSLSRFPARGFPTQRWHFVLPLCASAVWSGRQFGRRLNPFGCKFPARAGMMVALTLLNCHGSHCGRTPQAGAKRLTKPPLCFQPSSGQRQHRASLAWSLPSRHLEGGQDFFHRMFALFLFCDRKDIIVQSSPVWDFAFGVYVFSRSLPRRVRSIGRQDSALAPGSLPSAAAVVFRGCTGTACDSSEQAAGLEARLATLEAEKQAEIARAVQVASSQHRVYQARVAELEGQVQRSEWIATLGAAVGVVLTLAGMRLRGRL